MPQITLADIQAAHQRIAPHVRRTPIMDARPLNEPLSETARISLKLECLQVTGSFKPRGAVNKLLSLSEAQLERGMVTASGGNHGLGVAYTAWLSKKPVTVFLPTSTPKAKAEKIRRWGAHIVTEGSVWDDANKAALEMAERNGLAYIHPFADEAVIAGQGTVGLEILQDLPNVDTLLVAIGGGGLISGVALAAKALKPSIRVIGIEPTGAPTLKRSLEAGAVIELAEIKTKAGTLAPRRSAPINFQIIMNYVDDIVLVSDEEMERAARWLWFEMGIAAELSGAAAVAALLSRKYPPQTREHICALVCGAGTDGIE
jgi:threonine dehydratase